jgi:arylsulfatase A-like enzyme
MKLQSALCVVVAAFALGACSNDSSSGGSGSDEPPNLLVVIMDDVGIDQMQSFGYGGADPPRMPNVDSLARAGVRFRNAWSMPECSPGRSAMFSGRYPLRTGVYAALGPYDLANSQVSADEMTTPMLLKQARYQSAMFGKFHLAGPDNNLAGNAAPLALGWDYFHGWTRGGPASIDTSAGGIAALGTYGCGFVPSAARGGADAGACRQPEGSCRVLRGVSAAGDAPGKQCVISGGLFVPRASCSDPPPAGLDFTLVNAYYVSPLVIVDAAGLQTPPNSDPRARGYRSTLETDAAIAWINTRPANQPWMATVSYSAAHTPYQQPPGALVPGGGGDELGCDEFGAQRVLSNKMTEALDTELGRLLVATGLARRRGDGSLAYDPSAGNTVIVIVGDNGTFANAVKAPFDISRAKATAYQTGVWVPLIVAGPVVVQPDRDVEHMVNIVDVFRLFGELAGIDVAAAVPRTLAAAPLLPYLKQADQASIRTLNFTQGGYNLQANGQRNGACVVNTVIAGQPAASICTQSVFDKGPCEDNDGVWWGPGYTDPSVLSSGQPSSTGYRSCWQVNQAQYKAGQALTPIAPEITIALRNDTYKLVRNTIQAYDVATDSGGPVTADEFYAIDQGVPQPTLDTAALNLMPSRSTWSPALAMNYETLRTQLDTLLASQPACPGDGNIDNTVDALDGANWQTLGQSWGLSSTYDFNLDGLTDRTDLAYISGNPGACPATRTLY